jgi:tetratricopeptide (TPR) repeat protein
MSENNASASQTAANSRVIAELLDQVTELLAQRRDTDVESLLGRHPEHAERLRQLLPAMRLLANVGCAENAPPAGGSSDSGTGEVAGALGDFRILREIGRGGMGVVYEAEQLSLDRHVALKVLPFASVLDARQLQRFKNEARAAAGLHHTNIVPVYAVGSDRGVHYFAMQYIEGQTLERIIARLAGDGDVLPMLKGDQRGARAGGDVLSLRDGEQGLENDPEAATAVFPPPGQAGLGAVGHDTPDRGADGENEGGPQPNGSQGVVIELAKPRRHGDTSPLARGSTANGRVTPEYFRTVAELGIQAARALDYAHQQGVVHRDVKPSNLIVDHSGNLWITDFGLARMESEQSLTMSGDVLGTLRYMSPEQALAQRPLVDHRTDVYSLGATLYELLTLKAAFPETDRRELLRQIADEDPRKPRSLNRSIPTELETIVLKAMEKEPAGRYPTAQDLADDLQRFLDHKPIAARPPSFAERSVKWARRHRPIVSAAAVVMVVLGVAGLVALSERSRRQTAADALVNETLDQALVRTGEARAAKDDLQLWTSAAAVMERAAVLANATPTRSEVRQRLARLRTELEREQNEARARLETAARDGKALKDFDAARLEGTALKESHFDSDAASRAYVQAFRDYGIDMEQLSVGEAAHCIGESTIRNDLFVAVLDWAFFSSEKTDPMRTTLVSVATAAATDTPAWEKPLLDALMQDDSDRLADLAGDLAQSADAPVVSAMLGSRLRRHGKIEESRELLRNAQKRHPEDFWLNELLGLYLLSDNDSVPKSGLGSPSALPFLMVGVALRPQSPGAHLNFGNALKATGDFRRAIIEYRRALELRPDYAMAQYNLAAAFKESGDLQQAIVEYRRTVQLDPDSVCARNNLGAVLTEAGHFDPAIAELQRALELKPDFAMARANLADAFREKGDLAAAIIENRRAIESDPDYMLGHSSYAATLSEQGDVEAAIAEYRRAVELEPDTAETHYNLGVVLHRQGDADGAIAEYRRAIELKPDYAMAHNNLGATLHRKGDVKGAIAEYRKALDLKRDEDMFLHNLFRSLLDSRDFDVAISELREVLERKPNSVELHRLLGKALRSVGAVDDAIAEYRRAIELNPDDAESHEQFGFALQQEGRFDDAIDEYRRALILNPDFVGARINLGNALDQKGDPLAAIAEIHRALELDPNSAECHSNLGVIYGRRGDTEASIAEFRKALDLKPGFVRVRLNLGAALASHGDLDGAIAEFRRAAELDPAEPEAHKLLAKALHQKGDYRESLAALQRLHAIGVGKPRWPYPSGEWLKEGERLVELDELFKGILAGTRQPGAATEALELAMFAQRSKKYFATAAGLYRDAIGKDAGLAADPRTGHRYNAACAAALAVAGRGNDADKLNDDETVVWRQQALEWLRADVAVLKEHAAKPEGKALVAGMLTHWQKDPDLAGVRDSDGLSKLPDAERQDWQALWSDVGRLLEACRSDPAQGRFSNGNELFEKGDFDGAIAEYRRALEFKPDEAIFHNNLANALSRKGDLDGAILEYRRAIELKADFAGAHSDLGDALRRKGDMDGAESEFRRAVELQPRNATAHSNLGGFLAHKGDLDGAIAEFRLALELQPNLAEAHSNLGKAFRLKGDLDAAAAAYRAALDLKPDSVGVLGDLTDVLRAKGDFAESLKVFRRFHEVGAAKPRWAYPSAQWVKEGERLVQLDELLKDILAGVKQPATADEAIELAEFMQVFKQFYVAASEFYREAFAKDSGPAADPRNGRRYNAACAAALAAAGKGKDARKLSDHEIAAWRKQALEWLLADLAAWKQLSEKPEGRSEVAKTLAHWLKDPDLAGVRDAEGLAQLSETEGRGWQALWSDVGRLLEACRNPAGEAGRTAR